MEIRLLISITILAFTVAKLEVNIEDKYGWAEKLPTWRIKNKLTDLFLSGSPLTGYHLWLFSTILFLLHLPFILYLNWSLKLEAQILGGFFLFLTLEDLLWFVLNPAFGISKFNEKNVHWHKHWLGPIPGFYLINISVGIFLFALSSYLN